jgi:dCMP deaminase
MPQLRRAADDPKQNARDRYYMKIAIQVRGRDNLPGTDADQPQDKRGYGANCYGSKLGAVLVLQDRIVGAGYNGTPAGFQNCMDGGCVRCQDRWYEKQDLLEKMTSPSHVAGEALDKCICVHAEQNALLTAARFGIPVDGATLYVTLSPCFGCLKEAIQAGVRRIVYETEYHASYSEGLQKQYEALAHRLEDFGSLDPKPGVTEDAGPDAYSDLRA